MTAFKLFFYSRQIAFVAQVIMPFLCCFMRWSTVKGANTDWTWLRERLMGNSKAETRQMLVYPPPS